MWDKMQIFYIISLAMTIGTFVAIRLVSFDRISE